MLACLSDGTAAGDRIQIDEKATVKHRSFRTEKMQTKNVPKIFQEKRVNCLQDPLVSTVFVIRVGYVASKAHWSIHCPWAENNSPSDRDVATGKVHIFQAKTLINY